MTDHRSFKKKFKKIPKKFKFSFNFNLFFRFFNPLHSKPTGEGVVPETQAKGVLYDLDGKFAYSTYSEEMRSYHPMLDIRALTKDLK